jgi:hypothetical protein
LTLAQRGILSSHQYQARLGFANFRLARDKHSSFVGTAESDEENSLFTLQHQHQKRLYFSDADVTK